MLGRIGDKPAINIPPQGDHLVTIIYSTTENIVTYNKWSLFEKFLINKSLNDARMEHLQRNFPKTQFKEIYSRHAKSLISSGNGSGNDQEVGLEIEIVLKENPYTDDMINGLTIDLLYKGSPRAGNQIEIFSRANNEVITRQTAFTSELGQATFKVLPKTDYIINSVIMRQPKKNSPLVEESKLPVLWESLWASTSFRVP